MLPSGCFHFFYQKTGRVVGGGGNLPHISHIGMSPSGRVFVLFWFENENTFCPFWSRIGYDF